LRAPAYDSGKLLAAEQMGADALRQVLTAPGTHVGTTPEDVRSESREAQADIAGIAVSHVVVRAMHENQLTLFRSQGRGPVAFHVGQTPVDELNGISDRERPRALCALHPHRVTASQESPWRIPVTGGGVHPRKASPGERSWRQRRRARGTPGSGTRGSVSRIVAASVWDRGRPRLERRRPCYLAKHCARDDDHRPPALSQDALSWKPETSSREPLAIDEDGRYYSAPLHGSAIGSAPRCLTRACPR
jgi:hypothetical protein